MPASAAWPWLVASALIHLLYFAALIESYRAGDLGLVYPIARGSAPLMTAVASTLFVSEHLTLMGWSGIVTLAAGVLLLSIRSGHGFVHVDRRAVGYALLTALTISAYSVTDGIGARLSLDPGSYVLWLLVANAIALVPYAPVARPRRRDRGGASLLAARPGRRRVASPACVLRRRPLRPRFSALGRSPAAARWGIDASARVCFDPPPPAQPREHLAEATQQYPCPRFARTGAAPRQPRHASFARFVHNAMNVVRVKRRYRVGRPAISQPAGNNCQPFRSRLQAKQASLLAPAAGVPHGVALNKVPRGGGKGCLDAARCLRTLALLGDPAVGDNVLAHGSGAVHLLRHPPGADQGERHAKDRFSCGFLIRKIARAKGQLGGGAARAPEAQRPGLLSGRLHYEVKPATIRYLTPCLAGAVVLHRCGGQHSRLAQARHPRGPASNAADPASARSQRHRWSGKRTCCCGVKPFRLPAGL